RRAQQCDREQGVLGAVAFHLVKHIGRTIGRRPIGLFHILGYPGDDFLPWSRHAPNCSNQLGGGDRSALTWCLNRWRVRAAWPKRLRASRGRLKLTKVTEMRPLLRLSLLWLAYPLAPALAEAGRRLICATLPCEPGKSWTRSSALFCCETQCTRSG